MRGRTRIRKKRLERAGWKLVEEEQREGGAHLLVLAGGGERLEVEKRSRPRAWQAAEQRLLGGGARR